jgi:hypothetical protein
MKLQRMGFRAPIAQPEVLNRVRIGRRLVLGAWSVKTKKSTLLDIERRRTI